MHASFLALLAAAVECCVIVANGNEKSNAED